MSVNVPEGIWEKSNGSSGYPPDALSCTFLNIVIQRNTVLGMNHLRSRLLSRINQTTYLKKILNRITEHESVLFCISPKEVYAVALILCVVFFISFCSAKIEKVRKWLWKLNWLWIEAVIWTGRFQFSTKWNSEKYTDFVNRRFSVSFELLNVSLDLVFTQHTPLKFWNTISFFISNSATVCFPKKKYAVG